MAAVEAWFEGGPVDGRLLAVETAADGHLPDVVRLPQSGIYVGASDVMAPASVHLYLRVADQGGEVFYRYQRRFSAS